ncbi:hypothetical protein A5663_19625 [Mycobacterium sp. E740]|nr:hypothetical protein A5663_19625 [Mycobacterium sp. E740]
MIAAGALTFLGAFTLQIGFGPAESSASSAGETTTSTPPPSTMPIPTAKPTVKAQRPNGY